MVALALASLAGGARLLMLSAPARPDEAGYLLVAHYAGSGGPHLYGPLWVDRPPLLIAFFRTADALGGLPAVRMLALVPVVVVVLAACHAGRTLSGAGGALAAGAVAAALSATPLLSAPEVNGELLAVPFVMLSCAIGLHALSTPGLRDAAPVGQMALAGAVGGTALLVKQNFADALVLLSVVVVVFTTRRQVALRSGVVLLGCLVAGALLPVLLTMVWAHARGVGATDLWQVLLAFRSQSLTVITSSSLQAPVRRAVELVTMSVASGVLPLLAVAVAAHVRARPVPPVMTGIAAMSTVAMTSIVLGGSYWTHYATQLLPAAALSAAMLVRNGGPFLRTARLAIGLVLCSAVTALAVQLPRVSASGCDGAAGAAEVSRWLQSHAQPGDTAVTIYGGANTLLGSGARPLYPYLWSLPVRVLDPDLRTLVDAVSGPSAATWVVQTLPLRSWELDNDRRLRDRLRKDYSITAIVCDRRIFLRHSAERPRTAPSAEGAAKAGLGLAAAHDHGAQKVFSGPLSPLTRATTDSRKTAISRSGRVSTALRLPHDRATVDLDPEPRMQRP